MKTHKTQKSMYKTLKHGADQAPNFKKHIGMMRLFAISLILMFNSILAVSTYAQSSITIKGKVTDATGSTMPGVSVKANGTASGTITDLDGNYSLSVQKGVKSLTYSYIGMLTQEVTIENKTTINVKLVDNAVNVDELVVVGYGSQKKTDITGSVGIVNTTELKKYATSDVSQLLQGRVAGVQVNSDGQPGASPSIRIRGYSTFGDAQPLYVVDGVPVGTSSRDFNPNDIESMQVLKDASAGAIYGSRAANGVIIITTKQGKKSSPLKVQYNGYYGIDQIWQKIPVLGRVDYQTIVNEVRTNAGQTLLPGNDPSSPAYINNVDTDWQKEGLKLGTRQNHNVNLSGGGEFTTYNVALDYTKNDGTFVGNGPSYERYSARINSTAEKGIFKFGESFYYTQSHENTLTYNSTILKGSRPPMIIDLVEAVPTQKIYDANNVGGYGGTEAEIHNVISLNAIGINSMFNNTTDVDRMVASGYGELTLLKNKEHSLKFKTNLSYDKTLAHDNSFIPAFDLGYFFFSTSAQLDAATRSYTTSLIENTLNYKLNIGKHSLDVLAGQMFQSVDFYDITAHTEDLTEPYFPVLNNGSKKTASGSKSQSTLASYLGRLNYNYDDRYLLTATVRRDGSSRFAPSYRFGYFPSIALGWRLTNEKFIKLPQFITDIKLRGSYGQLGNENIGNYLYTAYNNPNIPYNFNGVKVYGGLPTSVVSESIKWEVKTTTNVGADIKLFDNSLDFSAEYYNNKTTDLLVGVPIPFSVGSVNRNPIVNAGSMQNSGFEFMATYHKTKGELRFDISANVSTLKNKVLSLGGNNEPVYGVGSKTEVGSEVGQHFGYETTGIFQTAAEVAGHAFQSAKTSPGDIIFKDQLTIDSNGDGVMDKADGIIDAKDRVYLGSAIPKLNFGFNVTFYYKKWDLSLFASGSAGYKINSRMYRDLMLTTDYINRSVDIMNRWTPTNTNTDIPRVVADDPNGNGRDSNRKGWLQNGDYLRINTLSLGYSFADNFIKGFSSTRVYVTAQNLFTFQSYKGFNPDFTSGVWNPGFDFGSYAKPRTILMGVQLSF
jgi:TonB-dependent starch-binding outer membrane protein SusC